MHFQRLMIENFAASQICKNDPVIKEVEVTQKGDHEVPEFNDSFQFELEDGEGLDLNNTTKSTPTLEDEPEVGCYSDGCLSVLA